MRHEQAEVHTCEVVSLDAQISQEPERSPVSLAIPAARHILHHVNQYLSVAGTLVCYMPSDTALPCLRHGTSLAFIISNARDFWLLSSCAVYLLLCKGLLHALLQRGRIDSSVTYVPLSDA